MHNDAMLTAAGNSLLIALVTSLVATTLGTMAGFALYQRPGRVLPVIVFAPIAMPEILMGVALLMFFVLINLTLGLLSITLAHIAFCIGYVAIVVRSRLAGSDESLVEAARDCGATPWLAFRHVTLPLQIYSMVKTTVTPEVNAISTLLLLLTLVLITAAAKIAPGILNFSE